MKNTCIQILSSIALFLVFLSVSSCSKTTPPASVVAPSVNTTNAIIDVTTTSAQSGGVVTNNGGAAITANGVVYSSTDQTPALDDSKTSDPVTNNYIAYPTFISNLTKLTPNTLYYVRAYATNSAGTGFGAVMKFTTSDSLLSVNSTVKTLAGNVAPGYLDGSGSGAQFNNPQGIAVDKNGNVFVGDTYNNYIREITPGGSVTTYAGNGSIGFLNGTLTNAEFYAPWGLAFNSTSDLYVADYGNNVIRKIAAGGGTVSTFVGNGLAGYYDGTDPLYYYYNNPTGVAFDATGNLYIADYGNNVIREVTPAGLSSTLAGTRTAGFVDGTGIGSNTVLAASFNRPVAVAVDANGNVYVADQGNFAIRKITPAGVVTTLAGGPTQPQVVGIPTGIALDATGNIYISDESGRILEYTTNNVLYVLAGSSTVSGFTDGPGNTATFNLPQGIALDANNVIYVADKNNHSIRRVTVVQTK
jgi:sugar lactone lactonase YvrE